MRLVIENSLLLRKRKLVRFRKELLNRKTKAELAFEGILKELGVKFRDQRVLVGANAITDYYIPYLRMCYEVDGKYHEFRQAYDKRRTKRIRKLNYGIARFKNEQVLNNPEKVKERIRFHLETKRLAIQKKSELQNNRNWYENPLNLNKALRFSHRFDR